MGKKMKSKKLKDQRYIFKRSKGKDKDGVEWFVMTDDTYKGMMKRIEMRKKYPLEVFEIIPLYEEGIIYKEDPINTKQFKLL